MKEIDEKDVKSGEDSNEGKRQFAGAQISDMKENIEIPKEEKRDIFLNKENNLQENTSPKKGWFQGEITSKTVVGKIDSKSTGSNYKEEKKRILERKADFENQAIDKITGGDAESKKSFVDDELSDHYGTDKDDKKNDGIGELGDESRVRDTHENPEVDTGETAHETSDEALDKDKAYTVSTTTFYDQYAGEINAYMREAPGMDEMDEGSGGEIPEHWLHKPKKRRKKRYLLKFIILTVVLTASFIFAESSYFDINQIEVEGNVNHSKSEIIKMSGIGIGNNTFKISSGDVKKKLLASPYISDVDLDRSLPKKITIKIKERMGMACIQNGKTYLMVDEHFVVLKKVKKPLKMTTIEGVKVKNVKVGKEVSAVDKDKLNTAGSLLKAMRKEDLFFKKIDVSGSVVKIYIYNKLICKGESRYLLKHIENKNLEKILYNLYKNKIKKGSIIISNDEYCSYNPKVN